MDELRTALYWATEEELQDLTDLLFRPKFNPLDYLHTPDPLVIQNQSREEWLRQLEERIRFLAADGMTVLRGQSQQLTYRQILVRVCGYLKLTCPRSLSTVDLEAEIFLELLGRAWKQLPTQDQGQFAVQLRHTLTKSQLLPQLPLVAQQDPMTLVLKGGTALAVTSVVRPMVLRLIARQFGVYVARYHMAQQAVLLGGAIATQFQTTVALQTARQGMAMSAARYATVRGLFACLGPALWACFLADLGWRAIATNYGRIIPTVYALAQIRLTRMECFELA